MRKADTAAAVADDAVASGVAAAADVAASAAGTAIAWASKIKVTFSSWVF